MTLLTHYPVAEEESHLSPQQEAQKEVGEKPLRPSLLLGEGTNMRTPHTKLPQRNTTTTSPHTTADKDGLPEAHAAAGHRA